MAYDIEKLRKENDELTARLADPAVSSDPVELSKIGKRQKQLGEILAVADRLAREESTIRTAEELLAQGDDASFAADLERATAARTELQAELDRLLVPRDPRDDKNAILEIRAGAGGDEASLFAGDLYGMYAKYAERQGWRTELLSSSRSEAGGFKEVVFEVSGPGVFGKLRYEAGTHRVQRIPVTESGGRIHTSTATVAVLPEAEEVELAIRPEELRIDVFRSSGPGGQSVNTTDSAVRITHLPSGLVVTCQDEKSQHKNRARAMTILRARLKAQQEEAAAKERGDARRAQVGTGDRSEKIRTYNVPQDRVTDHRIKLTVPGVAKVWAGELDPIVEKLEAAVRQQAAESAE